MGNLCKPAHQAMVRLLHSYETNLLNTAAQAMDFLEDAGHHPNIYVHLDSYHMNASGSWLA